MMRIERRLLVGVAPLLAMPFVASGSVVVEHRAALGPLQWRTILTTGSGAPINVPWQDPATWGGGTQYYRIRSTSPSTENIGAITFNPPSELPYQFLIGAAINVPGQPDGLFPVAIDPNNEFQPACQSLTSFRSSSNQLQVQISVGDDITGDIFGFNGGSVSVARIDVADGIFGEIEHTRHGFDFQELNVGRIGSSAQISIVDGELRKTTANEILGTISTASANGDIGDITVLGPIGSSLIEASILSHSGIGSITATTINATINGAVGLALNNSTGGPIKSLTTTDPSGTFQGLIRATNLTTQGTPLHFAGDVEG